MPTFFPVYIRHRPIYLYHTYEESFRTMVVNFSINFVLAAIRVELLSYYIMQNNKGSDFELVRSLKNGDIIAFEKLFFKYSKKLLYFSKGYLESEEDAKGMVQEVFLKIWENRENLNEHKSFNAYLYTITFNFVKMYYRRKSREDNKIKHYYEDQNETIYEMESEIDYNNLSEIINQAIEQLPEKRKQIFRMSRKEGLSNAEIAIKLGISKKTVENQITQAIKTLRKMIQDKPLSIILFFYLFFL